MPLLSYALKKNPPTTLVYSYFEALNLYICSNIVFILEVEFYCVLSIFYNVGLMSVVGYLLIVYVCRVESQSPGSGSPCQGNAVI